MSALVLVEHENQQIKPATLSAITAATKLSTEIDLLIAGHNCGAIAEAAGQIKSIRKIILADHACYQYPLPEVISPLLSHHAKDYEHIIAASTTFGKNILPRAAALLNVGQQSDVIEIIDTQTFCRPIYAGNAIATVKVFDAIKLLTIRSTAFPLAEQGGNAEMTISDFQISNELSAYKGLESHQTGRPELTSADVVISGGRGLQNKETFDRLVAIADKISAAIGASRAAVDAGFAPNDWQVGQTGQVVAPKLYIALGISGAIQHLAGMKDSKVIVAINKDPEAPIFQIADYALIADVNDVLDKWENRLK